MYNNLFLNNNELSILNSGSLSFEARLIYLTNLLPNNISGKAQINMYSIQRMLTVNFTDHLGMQRTTKAPSYDRISTFLSELLYAGLITQPINQDIADSYNNQVFSNQNISENEFNIEHVNINAQPDTINEIPDYIAYQNNKKFSQYKNHSFNQSRNNNNVINSQNSTNNIQVNYNYQSNNSIPTNRINEIPPLSHSAQKTMQYNDGDEILLRFRQPTIKDGVEHQLFYMTREWQPNEDFEELARFSGLSRCEYSFDELNDFTLYWSTKSVAYTNTDWLIKFIRFLKVVRKNN